MMSSEGFQYHFSIISKFICCDCYMKKNVAFTLISFAVLKWHECLSFQLPFELTVEIPVQLHLELEVNLLVHNVIEREIEREKVQMKPPMDDFTRTYLYYNYKRKWHSNDHYQGSMLIWEILAILVDFIWEYLSFLLDLASLIFWGHWIWFEYPSK